MVTVVLILASAAFSYIAERTMPKPEEPVPRGLGRLLDYFPYLLGGVIALGFSQISANGAAAFLILHSLLLLLLATIMRYACTTPSLHSITAGVPTGLLTCGCRVIMVKCTFLLFVGFTVTLSAIHLLP